jgi:hypothetical protein
MVNEKIQKTNSKNKTLFAIVLILMLTTTAFMIGIPEAQAVDIPTYLLINVAPDPIGVGQTVYVNTFLSKPPPTVSSMYGDRYANITIQVTRPDGTKQTLGPYMSDPTGGVWASIVPALTGEYSFQSFYPGQTLTGESPLYPGSKNLATNLNLVGSYMMPSVSEKVTLTVQATQISSYSSPALPTDYWARPIYSTNFAWAQLGGNWFGLRAPSFATTGMYDASGNFAPYTTAPNTAHIVWTKPTKFGGQVGAPFNADQESQYTSTSILYNHFEPIVLYGILYYVHYPTIPQVLASWEAVDLRTGKTIWSRPAGETGDEILRMGQIWKFHSIQEYGSLAFLWSVPRTGSMSLRLYDAMTGIYMANFTGATNMPFLMDFEARYQGTLLGWYTSGGNLTLWNSTKAMEASATNAVRGDIVRDIRPTGNINFSAGIQWTLPIANKIGNAAISPGLGIAARTPEMLLLTSAPLYAPQASSGFSVEAGYNSKTGQLIWGPLNRTIPAFQDIALLCARDGVYVTHNKDTNEAYGYSLTNGQQLWGPVKLQGNAWSSIARAADIAYGKVYIWDYGGYVNALDQQTGKIVWTFTPRSAGYDSPYGIFPLWHFGTGSIADGKLFLSEGHMYNPPLFPNAQRLAINTTTGELVWSVLSFSGRMSAAHADGYIVQWNSYDCQIYTFGKGQTATTISTQDFAAPKGTPILIQGTITDQSPGETCLGIPAAGTAAISDESMSKWMEYLYMQQPKPTNTTGVPVKLTAIDPNGNTQDIGTATSDTDGKYSLMWTPPVEGKYTITATFSGSDSYYASHESTALAVNAPSAQPTQAPTATPTSTIAPTVAPTSTGTASPSPVPNTGLAIGTEVYLGITAAVVFAAVAATALFLRKRK